MVSLLRQEKELHNRGDEEMFLNCTGQQTTVFECTLLTSFFYFFIMNKLIKEKFQYFSILFYLFIVIVIIIIVIIIINFFFFYSYSYSQSVSLLGPRYILFYLIYQHLSTRCLLSVFVSLILHLNFSRFFIHGSCVCVFVFVDFLRSVYFPFLQFLQHL